MLRRHWKLIILAMVIGAVIGVASTLTDNKATQQGRYYKATHTLFLDTSSVGDNYRPVYTNLDQIAVLVTTGDVPKRVASELGGDATEWTAHIFTVTNGTTNTLDIVCAEKDADESVKCADTFADELVASLKDREQTRFDSERDDAIARIDS